MSEEGQFKFTEEEELGFLLSKGHNPENPPESLSRVEFEQWLEKNRDLKHEDALMTAEMDQSRFEQNQEPSPALSEPLRLSDESPVKPSLPPIPDMSLGDVQEAGLDLASAARAKVAPYRKQLQDEARKFKDGVNEEMDPWRQKQLERAKWFREDPAGAMQEISREIKEGVLPLVADIADLESGIALGSITANTLATMYPPLRLVTMPLGYILGNFVGHAASDAVSSPIATALTEGIPKEGVLSQISKNMGEVPERVAAQMLPTENISASDLRKRWEIIINGAADVAIKAALNNPVTAKIRRGLATTRLMNYLEAPASLMDDATRASGEFVAADGLVDSMGRLIANDKHSLLPGFNKKLKDAGTERGRIVSKELYEKTVKDMSLWDKSNKAHRMRNARVELEPGAKESLSAFTFAPDSSGKSQAAYVFESVRASYSNGLMSFLKQADERLKKAGSSVDFDLLEGVPQYLDGLTQKARDEIAPTWKLWQQAWNKEPVKNLDTLLQYKNNLYRDAAYATVKNEAGEAVSNEALVHFSRFLGHKFKEGIENNFGRIMADNPASMVLVKGLNEKLSHYNQFWPVMQNFDRKFLAQGGYGFRQLLKETYTGSSLGVGFGIGAPIGAMVGEEPAQGLGVGGMVGATAAGMAMSRPGQAVGLTIARLMAKSAESTLPLSRGVTSFLDSINKRLTMGSPVRVTETITRQLLARGFSPEAIEDQGGPVEVYQSLPPKLQREMIHAMAKDPEARVDTTPTKGIAAGIPGIVDNYAVDPKAKQAILSEIRELRYKNGISHAQRAKAFNSLTRDGKVMEVSKEKPVAAPAGKKKDFNNQMSQLLGGQNATQRAESRTITGILEGKKKSSDVPISTSQGEGGLLAGGTMGGGKGLSVEDLEVSEVGSVFLKKSERSDFKPEAYVDHQKNGKDVYTVGYGFDWLPAGTKLQDGTVLKERRATKASDRLSKAEADKVFRKQVEHFSEPLRSSLKGTQISQGKFDALVSLAYNSGIDSDKVQSAIKALKRGDDEGFAVAFLMGNKSGGKFVRGLARRRALELSIAMEDSRFNQLADYSMTLPNGQSSSRKKILEYAKELGLISSSKFKLRA